MNITKTIRVIQLPSMIQEKIKADIMTVLGGMDEVTDYMVTEAMTGRLCDIEDLINIGKYLV